MTTVTTFDRYSAKQIQLAALEALRTVAAQYGLDVAQHGGRIDTAEFVAKFRFTPKAGTASAATAERAAFTKYCGLFGLRADQYGAAVTHKGQAWQVVGFRPNRPRFPILVRNAEGKEILLTEESLRAVRPADDPASPRARAIAASQEG